jgi:outer membrane protein assembly factor BamB
MTRCLRHGRLLLAALAMLALTASALAIIKALLPLDALVTVSQVIVVAKIEKVDAHTPLVVMAVQEDLKGKAAFRKLMVDFKGDDEAKKLDHVPQLLKRVAPELPVILFLNPRDKSITGFAYTNGTWFQLLGQQTGDASQVAWRLTHGEPYLRRTYKGPTAELRQLVIDKLAGKGKLPAVNEKEEPGFGPEATPKGKEKSSRGGGGTLFGVIPTLGVGAPLMVLAALFPAVFGGVLILFRQWIAFITVFSVNSTLLLLYWAINTWWPNLLRGTWIGTEAGLWFLMTVVALLCTVWAWRRQLARNALGDPAAEAPPKTELTVLWSLVAVFVLVSVATALFSWWMTPRYDPRSDIAWASIAVLTLGVFAGAIFRIGKGDAPTQPTIAVEGVMIAVILLGHIGYSAYRWGGTDAGSPQELNVVQGAVTVIEGVHSPRLERIRWQFSPENVSGLAAAAPLVHGDELYFGASEPVFKRGTLFCLDRSTGKKKWEFAGKDGDLREMISGPVFMDGRLYMGEGWHDDPNCRLFCIDAKEGKEVWTFKTAGQTECTPCLERGKVYFGAGNDGIYCVDATTGRQMWRFPPSSYNGRLLRFGSTPTVAGNRVYVGSAVDRNQPDDKGATALFCLDIETGERVWKHPVALPVWSRPVISNEHVIIALGNGDVFNDATDEKPAGTVLWFELPTGTAAWRYDVPNGVLDKPAVDSQHVYFGCRDGSVYCLGRHDGRIRWKAELGAPVIGTPALARCSGYTQTAHLFAVSSEGTVACINPASGSIHWTVKLADKGGTFTTPLQVRVQRTDTGDRRFIYAAGGVGDLFTGRPVVYCLEDFVKVE